MHKQNDKRIWAPAVTTMAVCAFVFGYSTTNLAASFFDTAQSILEQPVRSDPPAQTGTTQANTPAWTGEPTHGSFFSTVPAPYRPETSAFDESAREIVERTTEPVWPEILALEESDIPDRSKSKDFWLNSGAFVFLDGDDIKTFTGDLPESSRWRAEYAVSNALDTNDGRNPQTLLRLLTRREYDNATQTMYVTVLNSIFSDSPNRNESNGILSMMRYQNSDNLYYAGVRVDGYAIIKKKTSGVYRTLASRPVFDYARYDRTAQENLIPNGVPVGIRSDIRTLPNGSVEIILSLDIGRTGLWVPFLRTIDNGNLGGPPITSSGAFGVRSDFMEIEVTDFSITQA